MPYSLELFLAAAALALLASPGWIAVARRWSLFDHPGPRRIHREPVPTLGGLVVALAVLGTAWAARALPGPARELDPWPLIGLTLASLPVLALGVWDDVRSASVGLKLATQAIAGLVLFAFGYGIPLLTNPFNGPLHLGWLNLPLTLLWVMLVLNAINLIDGLDGLAAGVVMIACLSLWIVARGHNDFYVMFLSAITAGASLGFLRVNFPPARLFLGDTGSQFLGLLMAAVSLLENRKGTATVTLLLPLVTMGLPILDSALALLRRLFQGRPVFVADNEHIHHRLLRLGLSPRSALVLLYYLCAYLGVLAVVLSVLPRGYALLLLALIAVGLVFGMEALEFVDRRLPRDTTPPGVAGEARNSRSRRR